MCNLIVKMHTYLEPDILEKRTICNLFPQIQHIASCNASTSFNIIKQNKREHNVSLSEIIDAFWWCLYGMLYSTENERLNAEPHDNYFYDENAFQNDVECVFKCEMLRTSIKKHRYPIPTKSRNSRDKKKIKEFNDYCLFINRCVILMANRTNDNNDVSPIMYSPDIYKMNVDMARSTQENLIGNNPNFVNDIRKKQFITIGNFIDDVFIHRGYINKIKNDGGEMLTPEQVNEWETSKLRIRKAYMNSDIPEFVRIMIRHPDFILETIV